MASMTVCGLGKRRFTTSACVALVPLLTLPQDAGVYLKQSFPLHVPLGSPWVVP